MPWAHRVARSGRQDDRRSSSRRSAGRKANACMGMRKRGESWTGTGFS
jgi:hypothetical protein